MLGRSAVLAGGSGCLSVCLAGPSHWLWLLWLSVQTDILPATLFLAFVLWRMTVWLAVRGSGCHVRVCEFFCATDKIPNALVTC